MNTGVGGCSSTNMVTNKDTWIINKHPDVVFITVGMNDCRGSVNQTQYRANLETLLSTVWQTCNAIPVLQTQNYTNNASVNNNLDIYEYCT